MSRTARAVAVAAGSVTLFATTLIGTAPAAASTLYVDNGTSTCTDSGSGTLDRPYCTIKKAATVAAAGQTVLVNPGTYGGDIVVGKSGTSAAPIAFQRASGAVIVDGGTNGFKVSSKSWVTIKGFTVRNSASVGILVSSSTNVTVDGNEVSSAGTPVSGSTAAGIKVSGGSNSRVIGNVTHHNADHGITLTSATTGNQIKDNISYSNARQYTRAAEGIFLTGSSGNTVVGNRTFDNEDSGIGIWKGSNNCVVVNNVTYRNGDHGIDVLQSTGAAVVGNTVYRSVDSGIELQGNAGAKLANNVSVDNGINSPRTAGNLRVVDSGSAAASTLDYDLVYLSAGNDLIDWLGKAYSSLAAFQAATGREPNGRQGNPKFVAPTTGDFHLQAGSPAIDSANSGATGQLGVDAEGLARVDDPATTNAGAGPRSFDDRGAHEFQPGSQPANRPPVAVNDSATTGRDTAVKVAVLANDSDPDGDPLSVASTTAPGHGTATKNADGTVTYTPAAGYTGADSFGYTASDGRGGTASATVAVTVNPPPNRPPVAVNDSATTPQDTAVKVAVLANDSDPDGDPLSVASTTAPGHGTATKNVDGTVTYTPAGGYSGPDSFNYTASDGRGGTASATVSVTVSAATPANRPPVAVDDSTTTPQDTAVKVAVLANDSDPDGDPLSVASTTAPGHGTASANVDGTVTYTPAAGYTGPDSFGYTVSDGRGGTASATVLVTVTPTTSTNRPPVANNDSATTSHDVTVTVAVLANDSDPDGDALSVSNTTSPGHGTVTVNADQTVTYKPAAGYVGPDSFDYTVADGRGGTATATVSLTVDPSSELVGNGGFEADTSGWTGSPASTALSRVAGGHSGAWAAQLANSTAGAQCTLDDKPNWVAVTQAGAYTASVWARSDTAGLTLKLRIREYQNGTQVGSVSTTAPLTTSWQKVTLGYTPTAAGQSALDFQVYTANAPVGVCFQADDVSITH